MSLQKFLNENYSKINFSDRSLELLKEVYNYAKYEMRNEYDKEEIIIETPIIGKSFLE